MAKDFFQDIIPPSGSNNNPPTRRMRPTPAPAREPEPQEVSEDVPEDSEKYADDDISAEDTVVPVAPPRGIRNINMPTRTRSSPRPSINAGGGGSMGDGRGDMREVPPIGRGLPPRPRRSGSRAWMWILVVLCLLVIGFLALFMFRQTTITLTPRSQGITFDQSAQFTAYPQSSAATGTLAYTVATTQLSDSETVQGSGTTATQMKASGSITVYNAYSASSIKLIADTRFQTPTGLIFRVPAAIVIPGKVGTTAGHVTVTVVADQAGPQYNIGPTSRFTVPGLQSIPSEYAGVYGQSSGSMTGGFSGNQEGVADSVRQGAVADIRARLSKDVAQYVQSQNSATMTALVGLAQITYTDLPDKDSASSTQVQIGESAQVTVPVFPASDFASTVAQTVAITTDNASVTLQGGNGYGAQSTNATPPSLGTDPIDFSLVGSATFIWSIDTGALTQALAGRDQSVFQTIIGGFPGIEAAKARIEPFWKSSFPTDPSKIKVIVQSPAAALVQPSQSTSQSGAQQATQ
jgi:hypothetical protein